MLEELRAFTFVAELGSVQAAAAKTFRTQPAVSRQIQRLEHAMGVRLLDRRAKPVALSDEGRAVLVSARDVLARYDALMATFRAPEPLGLLRIGIAGPAQTGALAAALGRLRQSWPQVIVQLASGWTPQLREALRHGRLDAALTVRLEEPTGAPSPDDLVLVVAADADAPGSAAAMAQAPWVLGAEPCELRAWLQGLAQGQGHALNVVAEAQTPDLQLRLVAEGLGVGLAPRRLAARTPETISLRIAELPSPGLRVRCELEAAAHAGRMAPVLDHFQRLLTAGGAAA